MNCIKGNDCLVSIEPDLKCQTPLEKNHYGDVIMGAIASQITSLTVVYSIDYYSDVDQRKHQSSASLAFVQRIHRGPGIHLFCFVLFLFVLGDSFRTTNEINETLHIERRLFKSWNILHLWFDLYLNYSGVEAHTRYGKGVIFNFGFTFI